MTINYDDGAIPQWTQGEALRKAREDAGLTQRELADRLGSHVNTIRDLEGDARPPRRPVIMAWALATGVSVRWLSGEGWAPWGSNPQPAD